MAISAHPDDIEFGSVGTLARWGKEGCQVAYVLVTSGDVGIAKEDITRQQAADIREAETLAAAAPERGRALASAVRSNSMRSGTKSSTRN